MRNSRDIIMAVDTEERELMTLREILYPTATLFCWSTLLTYIMIKKSEHPNQNHISLRVYI